MIYVFFFYKCSGIVYLWAIQVMSDCKAKLFSPKPEVFITIFHPSSFYFAHYNYRFFVCFFLLCFHVIRNLFFHFFYYYYCVTFSVILRLLRVKLTFFVLNNCLSPILFSGFFFWWPSELLLLGVKKKKR